MPTGEMRVVENLKARMIDKRAGTNALAKRAGVNKTTVWYCRKGKAVRKFTADCIEQALEKFVFDYGSEYHARQARRYA